VVFGSDGPDSLRGSGGNDLLLGFEGDDTIDGGQGVDTAAFTEAFANYTVLIEDGGIRITDTVASRDGVDQVVNVERFLFADGEYKVKADGTGLDALSPQAAQVLDRVQGSGYTDAVDSRPSTLGPDWLDGQSPLLIRQETALSGVTNTATDGDNLMKYFVEFVADTGGGAGTTKLSLRFDTDPDNNDPNATPAITGQVSMSNLIEYTFTGNVVDQLVPSSLSYSG
jgi:hypothetical protein